MPQFHNSRSCLPSMTPTLQSLSHRRERNLNPLPKAPPKRRPLQFEAAGGAGGTAMKHPVVLITGALTGIGRAAALAFATEGSRLVVSGRHEEAGQALADELRGLGAEAEFIRADVRYD